MSQPELALEFNEFPGGPPFDHTVYNATILQATELLRLAVNTYWEKASRSDEHLRKVKEAALALFEDENPGADPHHLVTVVEPPKLGRGYLGLYSEMVPAWVPYCSQASRFLEIVEKSQFRNRRLEAVKARAAELEAEG